MGSVSTLAHRHWFVGGLASAALVAGLIGFTPAFAESANVIELPPARPVDATVDPGSRASVKASLPTLRRLERVPHNWTGNTASCTAGDTSVAYKQATLDTVNWYRNMVGLTDAVFSPERNREAQEAALMMAAAGDLSHRPDQNWPCWSQLGQDGAGSSNLYLGLTGPVAIHGYISDPGSNNVSVGHRAWILKPGAGNMGTGDTSNTNALHVTDNSIVDSPGIAWPSPGYFPADRLPDSGRWSFFPPTLADWSADRWDLGQAQVTVTGSRGPISLKTVAQSEGGLVWEISSTELVGIDDATYQVEVAGAVRRSGDSSPTVSSTFRYTVIVIAGDPPGPVTDLKVIDRTPSSVKLSWSNPGDSDLAEVIVRRAKGNTAPTSATDGTKVTLNYLTATSVTDSGLASDTTYSYAVFTKDTTGNVRSSGTTTTTSTTQMPKPPVTPTPTSPPASDTTAPNTRITSGTSGKVSSRKAKLSFISTEAGSTFQCKLDSGSWQRCSSTKSYSKLPNGNHSFKVRATDKAGNTDRTPAIQRFTTAKRAKAKLKANNNRSKLLVDVNPNNRSKNYKIKVQQKKKGKWKTVRTTRTKGARDKRTIDLGKGAYRVVVPAQHDLLRAKSSSVKLRR